MEALKRKKEGCWAISPKKVEDVKERI